MFEHLEVFRLSLHGVGKIISKNHHLFQIPLEYLLSIQESLYFIITGTKLYNVIALETK